MNRLLLENVAVYDIETAKVPDDVDGGWSNPEGMGFAAAVAYFYRDDRYLFYKGEAGRQRLARDLTYRMAVTFNGIRFDSLVLLGNDRDFDSAGCMTSNGGASFYNYDILVEYASARLGYLVEKPPAFVTDILAILKNPAIHDGTFNLNALAKMTLGAQKSGNGAAAPALYQDGKLDELYEYCLHDVRITKRLFEFILNNGFVIDGRGSIVRISRCQFTE
jgi:DEAD/DEAH box helicase domain-containing protein